MMLSFLNDLSVVSAFKKISICSLRGMLCALLLAAPAFAAATTTTLSVTSGGSVVTTVASGSVVTLTATVMSGATGVTTGLVNFCDATATYCTDIHILGSAQLTSAGTATVHFVPGIGSHSYKAVFAGTNNDLGSSSSASALTVTGIPPTTTTIAQSGSAGDYTLTATVFGTGASVPTGTVSFLDTSNGNQVLGTAALGTGAQGLSFASLTTPATSAGPLYFEGVADFNGDGKLDLVTLNSGKLTLLLGNGDGTFTAGTNPITSLSSSVLAVGDFNGDGNVDLALATGVDNSIVVLLGNGDGTFTESSPSALFDPSFGPGVTVVGDFNGDGKLDLAIATEKKQAGGPTKVMVALGNGDGTFTAATSSFAINAPDAMASGDFNGDGKLDLVVQDNGLGYPVHVLLGNGDGTFTAAADASAPGYQTNLLVADFNGDGKPDLIANSNMLLGNGDGTFTALPAGNVPYIVEVVGDFNNDGKPDLAGATSGSNTVTVSLGNGDGTFTTGASQLIGKSLGLLVRDFNGDGASDLAVTNGYDNTVTVLLAQSAQATATVNSIALIGTGTHQVGASYPGDSGNSPSVSSTTGLTAQPSLTPSITFTVANHTYGDAPFSIAATSNSTGAITYSVVSGPATLSGSTVTLTGVGAVVLQASQASAGNYDAATKTASITVQKAQLTIVVNNTARIFGAANPTFTATVTGAVNGDTFVETFSTTATAASTVGIYPIVPSVTGTNLGNYTVAATNGVLTISQAGTATTFALSNQNLTLTATVAPLVSGVPTGSVSFYEGQTLVGTGTLSNGVASYTASSFPAGNVVVSAQYSGDANFTQSASPPILVLSVTPTATALTVAQAGSVMDTLNLSPVPGYTGVVQLSCGNLPPSATCSFQPSSLTFTGTNSSASASVTIQTGVSAQAALVPLQGREDRTALLAAMVWMPGLLLALGGNRRRVRSRIDKLVLLTLLCGMAATLTACGGSSTPGSGSTGKTPTGAYTVQVVASGPSGLSQTTNLNLTVQ